MSWHTKTITIPYGGFGNTTSLLNNTWTLIGSLPIPIPENNDVTYPVKIRDASLFMAFTDTVLAASTITYTNVNVAISTANTMWTEPDDLTNTGENMSGVIGPINVTSQFSSNFGGTGVTYNTATVHAQFQIGSAAPAGTTGVVTGVCGWVDLTYEFETARTGLGRTVKTICLPLSEISGALTTTANTRTANIPQLTGTGRFLPENNIEVHAAWITIRSNDNNNGGATPHFIRYNYDNGAPNNLPMCNSSQATDGYHHFQINVLSFGSTSQNSNIAFFGSLATRWHNMVADLWVTYSFDANSNSTLNYVEIPFTLPSRYINGLTTTTANSRLDFDFRIPEPEPIALVGGAVELAFTSAAAGNVLIRMGNWASGQWQPFPWTAASCTGGQLLCQTLFDSRSNKGQGVLALSTGKNQILADFYLVSGTIGSASGRMKVLYRSNVANSGIERHSRVVRLPARQIDFTASSDTLYTNNVDLRLADTAYGVWFNSFAAYNYTWPTATATTIYPMLQIINGENRNQGWVDVPSDLTSQDAEISYLDYIVDFTGPTGKMLLNRWWLGDDYDYDTSRLRSNVASRAYRVAMSTATRIGTQMVISLHNCLSQWRGNVTNTSGGNVTIWLHDADTNEPMYRGFRTGNGEYTIYTFNANTRLWAQAYENGNRKGRSNTSNATQITLG